MRITVAVCTHNRAERLMRTLASLVQCGPRKIGDWEVIVVDNASTDRTKSVLESFQEKLPLRVFYERQPGHSNARNRAIRAANGEYIVWTDDDVLVDGEWLNAYDRAFREHPSSAFFGGPITPLFEPDAPRWLRDVLPSVGAAFAQRDLGRVGFKVDSSTLPYGANFAVRASDQRRFPYNPILGQRPCVVGVGDETDVLFAMWKAGLEGWWVPDARVQHIIGGDRQSWSYIDAHWRAQGVAMAHYVDPHATRGWLNAPWRLWTDAARASARYRLARLLRGRRRSVPERARAHMTRAMLNAVRNRACLNR